MKELSYGETPWDDLSEEELLREVQRMYDAVLSLNSALSLVKGPEPASRFWGKGTGGNALKKAAMILDPIRQQYDEEQIYRCFFRYAVDLLFTPELGSSWTA